MEYVTQLIDFILHINVHLDELAKEHGAWLYAILFLIVFAETGLVVTPFLPGDSLLFATGAICAQGSLDVYLISLLLFIAAVLGDTVNYWVGYYVGPKVFSMDRWFLKKEHMQRTHDFCEKYGGKAIIFARFVPIVRTFAPFVVGVGKMTYRRFMMYNIVGGFVWVVSFTFAGYLFGNMPAVKKNFTLVILGIIVLSVMPAVIEFFRHKKAKSRPTVQQAVK
jgi:membrane-associated protein